MGILKKLIPKRTPSVVNKVGNAVAPAVFTEPEPKHVPLEATGGAVAPEDDDEPTWFSTFMVFFYGFFGITLLVYPSVHAQDGPFPNPLAYWTTVSKDLEFGFRMLAAFTIALLIGPFTDEIFGGVGVRMKAFVEQMMVVNTIVWFIFVYYTFWSPLDTMVPLTWKAQTYFGSAIVAWNLSMLLPDAKLKEYYVTFCAVFFGFFGVALSIAPSIFFGPPSPTAYWTVWDEGSYMNARALGLTILIFFAYGKFYIPTDAFAKMIIILNVLNVPIFILPAYYGGASAVGFMWEIQLAVQVILVMTGLYLLAAGETGPWSCSCAMPSPCGLTVDTFNLVNVVWFVPFIVGFLYDPNFAFGPANPMGISLFTSAFTETAIWFGKAWGVTIFTIVFGPYLFGAPPKAVATMVTLLYVVFVGLFIYALLAYDILNFVLVAPTTGLNFFLAIFGFYAVSQAPGDMF